MKLLVTGGSGFIGSHVILDLLSKNNLYELIVLDNFSNSSKETLDKISSYTNKKITYFEVDLRDEKKLNNILKLHKPDITIHLAGLKSVAESELNPILYYENNVSGTIQLLKCLENTNCKKIIFSSSATVYGNPIYLPYDENHPTIPTNVYGKTKLICEELIEAWTKNVKSRSSILLRYFNPVGAHQSGLFGENPLGTPNNLFPMICKVADRKYDRLNIFGKNYNTHDGTAVRDYLHVMDIANAHSICINIDKQNTRTLKINLGSGLGITVLEILKKFEKVNNIKIPYVFRKKRKGDLDAYWASPQLAKNLLEWRPDFSIEDACKHSWDWYKNKAQV